MFNFPVTVIDNFYTKPDEVRDFALQHNFFPTEKGYFPGRRTEGLDITNRKMFDWFCVRLFALFYNIEMEPEIEWEVTSVFDLPSRDLRHGWIHTDNAHHFAGVVYLSPDEDLKAGTNLYQKKGDYNIDTYVDEKERYYKERTGLRHFLDVQTIHNSYFEETLAVKNVYNRLVMYDSQYFHAHGDFTNIKERLTQVFHVKIPKINNYPITKMKKHDNQLKYDIRKQ